MLRALALHRTTASARFSELDGNLRLRLPSRYPAGPIGIASADADRGQAQQTGLYTAPSGLRRAPQYTWPKKEVQWRKLLCTWKPA
jgi:hypothetical protein